MADALRTNRDDHLADLLLEVGIGEDVRFDHLHQHWLVWNGVRWRPDRQRQVYDLVRDYTVRLMTTAEDREEPGEFRKMLLPLFDTSKKESVLKSLSARKGIAMAGDEWDRDPYLLGFENGVLDLRDRSFDAHPTSDLLISKSVGCNWDPDADCPTFKAFLVDIMDSDEGLVRYMMTLLGYAMYGLQSEQKFWMWVGRGSNGKGILARTMARVLGDYADTPSDTLYMKNRFGAAPSSAARPDLVRLQGVRFTYMSEPQGGQFNEEMLKAHTGEDVILARDLYGKAGQMAKFPPTHKIIFLTNDPPRTDDVGISMRRRARVIQFEQDYTGDRADMTIEARIEKEKEGILALLTVFAVSWWNDGSPGLVEPHQISEWSDAYIEDNDPLAKFIVDCCVIGTGEVGALVALWSSYEDWCARKDMEPKSQIGFSMALSHRFRKEKTRTGVVYRGIRARSITEEAGDGDD